MELSFSIEGEKQLSRKLRGIESKVKVWRPTLNKVGDYLIKTFSGPVFETRGKEIGEKWQARKNRYPWPILERSGKMRKSFKSKATNVQLQVYNTTDYFKFHQSKALPRKKLPRRVMMKIDRERREGVVKIFHQRLVKQIIKQRYGV